MRKTMRAAVAATLLAMGGAAAEDYASWPLLRDPFPSTGGGGIMIGGYDPVVADGKCTTAFTATTPDGTVYRNRVEFDAVPAAGGVLCTNGRWRLRHHAVPRLHQGRRAPHGAGLTVTRAWS